MTTNGLITHSDTYDRSQIAYKFFEAVYYQETETICDICQKYNNKSFTNLIDEPLFTGIIGMIPDTIDRRHPALFKTIFFNQYKTTEVLLKLGANPNYRTIKFSPYTDDPQETTPLWVAASKTQFLNLTVLLLKYGAEIPKELSLTSKARDHVKQAKTMLEQERWPIVSKLNDALSSTLPLTLYEEIANYLL